MNLGRTLLLATSYSKHRAFVRDARDPRAAQARVWRETWAEIGASPFWRARMAAASNGPTPPLTAFPITTWDDYRDALARSYDSPRSELSGADILFWSESAGSTGPRKLFPITRVYQRQFQTTTPPFLHGLARRFRGFLGGPVLYFAGSMPKERSPAGVPVGFISNFNYRNIPAFLRKMYAFPVEALRDGETFFDWGPLYALASDLSVIVGITPAIMVRFVERTIAQMDRYWPILEGRAAPPAPLPPVRVSPERLALLRGALAKDPPSFRELWPSLEVVSCWKASTCGMQIPSLQRYSRDVPIVDATYSATEGWVNVPSADGSVGGAVHPGAHVIELLPLGAAARAENLIPLWEAEPDRDYEIFLTTAMGLVRYRLHDVVRCTGRFHESPVIRFSHKASSEISLGPACISEAELVEALRLAQLGETLRRVFAPAASGDRLELCVAADDASKGPLFDVARLEESLRAQNPMYRKYVSDGSLKPIALRSLRADHPLFSTDHHHAQTKPKLLLNEPADD